MAQVPEAREPVDREKLIVLQKAEMGRQKGDEAVHEKHRRRERNGDRGVRGASMTISVTMSMGRSKRCKQTPLPNAGKRHKVKEKLQDD